MSQVKNKIKKSTPFKDVYTTDTFVPSSKADDALVRMYGAVLKTNPTAAQLHAKMDQLEGELKTLLKDKEETMEKMKILDQKVDQYHQYASQCMTLLEKEQDQTIKEIYKTQLSTSVQQNQMTLNDQIKLQQKSRGIEERLEMLSKQLDTLKSQRK